MARIDEVLAGEASWGAWWLDFAGHAGLGAAYALPFQAGALLWLDWSIPTALGIGLGAALFGGVIREVVQCVKSGKLHPLDRSIDALTHLVGAPVALGIVLIARALS